ncbi:hypothetical protein PN462_14090 [Spirulina sp. CS-785/01]|uniref:hypothetical protein n=1 Tax=Spirulina sp. CS-785/01 TaxID=3021716 RepID=UPI00232F06BC|nr:hypothetical protein [Spirulina sp. CS-785/01]MDB9314239.1 hypothetical protein [Spirulina sp. CS-785/01]
MTIPKKFITIAFSSIIGGVIGVFLASPVSYSLIESIPGRGSSRNCSAGDMVCNSMRNRERFSGQGYRTFSQVDQRATVEKQVMYGAIGVVVAGVPTALLMLMVKNNKKE